MTPDPGARRFFFVLLILSVVLVSAVFLPIAGAIFLAAVAASVLAPVHRRLARRMGGRSRIAAMLVVIGVLLLLVGPLVVLSASMLGEINDGVRFIYDTVKSEGVTGLIAELPLPLQELATRILDRIGDLRGALEQQLSASAPKAAAVVGAAVVATGSLIFQLAMMLVALFFLLIHGDDLVNWLGGVTPMGHERTRELIREFNKVSYAVIIATLLTAAVQAAAALAGYLIARVPHPVFFTALTFIVALIPLIGAASVCLFAALILVITGHAYMAVFLALWGLVVVGLIDNIVKPYLMQGELEMGGAVVFFALIGGLVAFGPLGLLIGPLAVSFFLALLRIYERDFKPNKGSGSN